MAKPRAKKASPLDALAPSPLVDVGRPKNFKGVEEFLWVNADQLGENPANWRKHTNRQVNSLKSMIDEVGFVIPVLYNRRTGHLIDGHARKSIKKGSVVPVGVVDCSLEDERKLLATIDPIAAMAEADTTALKALTEQVEADMKAVVGMDADNQKQLESVTADLNYMADQLDRKEWEPSLLPSAPEKTKFNSEFKEGELVKLDQFTFEPEARSDDENRTARETIVFPTSNSLGIPDLLPDMLYDGPTPNAVWASGPKGSEYANIKDASRTLFIFGSNRVGGPQMMTEFIGGIVCFFTEDERFERCWNQPVECAKRLQSQQWSAACTPDYSTWWNFPLAIKIYNIYRARWCGRLWQENGTKLIPCLVTGGDPSQASMETAGIPRNAPLLGFECRAGFSGKNRDNQRKVFLACINAQLALLKPQRVFVYGGKDHADWLDGNLYAGPEYVLTDQWATIRQQVSETFTNEKDTTAAAQKPKRQKQSA